MLALGIHTCFGGVALCGVGATLHAGNLGILGLFPLIEFGIGLSLGNGTLLNTNLEVAAKQNSFVGEDAANCVARLHSVLQPLHGLFLVEDDGGRVGQRVVGTQFLDKSSVAWCSTIRYNDMVEGLILLSMTLQSHSCWHNALIFSLLLIICFCYCVCKDKQLFRIAKFNTQNINYFI